MKTLTTSIFALLIIVGTVSSCSKKDSTSSSTSTKKDALTSGSWTLQDYQKKNASGTWVSEGDPDIVHYTITFYANNTYAEQTTGASASWSTNSDFSQLTLGTGTDAFGTFQVNTLTSTSLQLINLNPASGELYVYTH